MKREIFSYRTDVSQCCPGHDKYPNDTYSSNRSKRARSRDKKKEHKYARTLRKRALQKNIDQ